MWLSVKTGRWLQPFFSAWLIRYWQKLSLSYCWKVIMVSISPTCSSSSSKPRKSEAPLLESTLCSVNSRAQTHGWVMYVAFQETLCHAMTSSPLLITWDTRRPLIRAPTFQDVTCTTYACAPGSKHKLNVNLQQWIGSLLPENTVFFRLSPILPVE